MGPKDIEETLNCACHSPEHQLMFQYIHCGNDIDNVDNELYCSTFLSPTVGIFQRIGLAIGYVFGYRPQYGHFDCFVMKEEDIDKMIRILNHAKSDISASRARFEVAKKKKEPLPDASEITPPR